jgi:hypothetical protein
MMAVWLKRAGWQLQPGRVNPDAIPELDERAETR